MSDENGKTPEQQYIYHTDQQVSVNAYFDTEINGETVRFQITNRYGATPEKVIRTVKAAVEAFSALRQEYPRQLVTQPKPQEPTRQPLDDNGNDLPEIKTMVAEKLSVSMHDGKYYYKVMGKPFTQYGVTVWGEVLEAAGVKIDHANLANLPNIAGWRADYIMKVKDGRTVPDKVTRLLPSTSPY